MTIKQAKEYGISSLKSPSPSLDSEVFLKEILGCDKTFLLFHSDMELSIEQQIAFEKMCERRKTGLPVAYITGKKEFFGYEFYVCPDVLIPKPDTEVLVENSLRYIEKLAEKKDDALIICDMCTGSGCVGISIMKFIEENWNLSEKKLPELFLCDISRKALEVAEKNARKLLSDSVLKNINFIHTNLFEKLENHRFDIIVSNPPYVPCDETVELLKDGRNEPSLALDGDVLKNGQPSGTVDGLEIIRNLIPESKDCLVPGGILILETGEYNACETEQIMKREGFKNTALYRDYEGQLRNVYGEIGS